MDSIRTSISWRMYMDMFMDKLAQRLNAQEIIKANTAAETEELNQLKDQVAAYNECLSKLQVLVETGTKNQDDEQAQRTLINELIEESIRKIQEIQENGTPEELQNYLTEQLKELTEATNGKLAGMEDHVHKECVKVYRNVQAVVVEEGQKQNESLATTEKGLRGKLNAILGISIVALIASLASVALQVLKLLQIL